MKNNISSVPNTLVQAVNDLLKRPIIERAGPKIIFPSGMPYEEAIAWLHLKAAEEKHNLMNGWASVKRGDYVHIPEGCSEADALGYLKASVKHLLNIHRLAVLCHQQSG